MPLSAYRQCARHLLPQARVSSSVAQAWWCAHACFIHLHVRGKPPCAFVSVCVCMCAGMPPGVCGLHTRAVVEVHTHCAFKRRGTIAAMRVCVPTLKRRGTTELCDVCIQARQLQHIGQKACLWGSVLCLCAGQLCVLCAVHLLCCVVCVKHAIQQQEGDRMARRVCAPFPHLACIAGSLHFRPVSLLK